RPEFPDYPYHVLQYLFFIPYLKSFIGNFGETEVIGPAKKLFTTIDLAGFYKFLCAYNAQKFTQFKAYEVLAAISPGQGKITGTCFLVISQKRDKPCVFVIRVRC